MFKKFYDACFSVDFRIDRVLWVCGGVDSLGGAIDVSVSVWTRWQRLPAIRLIKQLPKLSTSTEMLDLILISTSKSYVVFRPEFTYFGAAI